MKNEHAVALGRKGGLAKAKKLTPKQRKDISIALHKAKKAKKDLSTDLYK